MTFQQMQSLYDDAELRKKVATLVSLADLGIADLSIQEVVIPDAAKSLFDSWKPLTVQLLHRIDGLTLPLRPDQESRGTFAFICLLEPAISAIGNGGVVLVDELDHSLHPLLATQLIRLFSDTKSNPASAQLIFNTHDTNLLGAGVLRRDQIWFTEKARDGASQLYPLTDFKPRKQENLENGYLQGRYGAIPFLNADRFLQESNEENG